MTDLRTKILDTLALAEEDSPAGSSPLIVMPLMEVSPHKYAVVIVGGEEAMEVVMEKLYDSAVRSKVIKAEGESE